VYVGAGIGASFIPLRLGERAQREVAIFELGMLPGTIREHHGEQPPLRGRTRRWRAADLGDAVPESAPLVARAARRARARAREARSQARAPRTALRARGQRSGDRDPRSGDRDPRSGNRDLRSRDNDLRCSDSDLRCSDRGLRCKCGTLLTGQVQAALAAAAPRVP